MSGYSSSPFHLCVDKIQLLYLLPLLPVELDKLTMQLLESFSPFHFILESLMCSYPFLNILMSE